MQFRNIPLVAIVMLTLITPLVFCSSTSSAYFIDSKLWELSDTIVIGTVTSINSEESGDRIFHSVDVEVERYLKNPSEASTLVIHYSSYTLREWVTPGGTVYEWISGIERMLGFNVGEKVYVFLLQVTPDFYEVLGGSQGKYSIFDGVAMNSDGRRMNIPTPLSQSVMIEAGIGLAVILTIWIKRDWLSERIVGATNG